MITNLTTSESEQLNSRHLSTICQIVVTISYCMGIIGNSAALYNLRLTCYKHKKIILMLRCLAINDLLALLGMLVLMTLQLHAPFLAHNVIFCGFRVFWRVFGLGSGCIAIAMAIERWLALTKPFLCKQYVTYKVVKQAIFYLWIIGAILTCLPFLGFGLFFKQDCMRYRDAMEPKDIVYAYIFFTFGTLLCACIVWCNLGVVRELTRIGNRPPVLVRRISRSSTRCNIDNATAEELAFAKLMLVLCISFVICWMPQMISIPMAQFGNKSMSSYIFFRVADILMAVHFTIDPFVYVLLRFKKERSHPSVDLILPLTNVTSRFNPIETINLYDALK